MYILGISCYYHDSAAVLIKDGVIVAAAEEERFSRKKHDASFPKLAIQFCFNKANITSKDLEYVVFYEKPFLKFERIFLNSLQYAPKSLSFFRESMKEWFFDKLWIKSNILSEIKIDPKKLLFSEHHLSHMASSYYCSPFQKAAVISIDGVGEWTTTSWGVATGNTIEIKEEIRYPNSIGLLYSAFTVFAGYEANEGEYKLMGLAPYGKPLYADKIFQLLTVKNDGSFSLESDYFSYPYNLTQIYTKKFIKLFGEMNSSPETVIQYYADIAASIQFVTEELLVRIATYVQKKTGLDSLCYAGGVALNSKANWQIANRSGFKNIFIQPAAGDSGGALGAALWVYHGVLGKTRTQSLEHVYFGASESRDETKKILDHENISYRTVRDEDKLSNEIAHKIVNGKVIGWVQGEFEWGPRSLGHRSILADPRSFKMKETVNSKIKFREAFRPFAPSVIAEKAPAFFEVGKKYSQQPLEYMLYVVPVVKKKREELQAITHVDGTARPQFVHKKTNQLYHSVISTVGEATGVPVVLNTSFNLKGEPIVNTTREALSTFNRSGIDTLVVNNFIIEKK